MPLCPSLIIGQILNYKSKNLKQKIDIYISGWITIATRIWCHINIIFSYVDIIVYMYDVITCVMHFDINESHVNIISLHVGIIYLACKEHEYVIIREK